MTHDIAGMALVASGTPAQVKRWTGLLRKASIQFAVIQCGCDDGSTPFDHSEVWVERADVDKARSALRNTADDRPLLS